MRFTCCLLALLTMMPGCGRWRRERQMAACPSGCLAMGTAAPEIVGEDLDGAPFKLSDYRGKVVVLDFWGHW